MRVVLLNCNQQGYTHMCNISMYVDRDRDFHDLIRVMVWKYHGENGWIDVPDIDTVMVARAAKVFNLSVEIGVPYVDGEPDELFSDILDEFGV